MDKSMYGMIMGVIVFIVIYTLSVLKVNQTIIGGALVVAIILGTIVLKKIKPRQ
ncbi:hypothetical protein [Companilactobacillus musae]|uniref:hypothetical protein n=1 Tax=Companilactobacillus musae TaxID=1903258 RepID=UPI0013C2EA0C|nr:hypothetical protein [Companilactobacillus musae]